MTDMMSMVYLLAFALGRMVAELIMTVNGQA